MQKERLTLKLPMEPLALRHAGDMLLAMAVSLGNPGVVTPAPAAELTTLGTAAAPAAAAPAAAAPAAAAPAAAAPAAAAPAAAAPAAAAPAGVELGTNGLPWDGRIHSKNRGKDVNGDWKYLRGVDRETLVPTVEAELRGVMAAAPSAPAAAAELPPPPPPAGTADSALPPAMGFPGIVSKVTALQNAGRITPAQIEAVVIAAGLPSFPLLGSRPDLIPTIDAEIDKLCPPIQ